MLEMVQHFFHIPKNGDMDLSFDVVPSYDYPKVFFYTPIFGQSVMLF